jgi:hypothetical protein
MKKVRVPKEKEGRKGWKEEDRGGPRLWRKSCGVEIGAWKQENIDAPSVVCRM